MTRLLIVDDEAFTVDMLQTFLQLNGYEVFGAYNGEDGLVLLQVEQPEVVILDLMLPDIEGYEVCQRLRSQPETSKIPVLILSARAESASREKALQAGADAYLTKPVQFPTLLSELSRIMTMPRATQPVQPAPQSGSATISPAGTIVRKADTAPADSTQPKRPSMP